MLDSLNYNWDQEVHSQKSHWHDTTMDAPSSVLCAINWLVGFFFFLIRGRRDDGLVWNNSLAARDTTEKCSQFAFNNRFAHFKFIFRVFSSSIAATAQDLIFRGWWRHCWLDGGLITPVLQILNPKIFHALRRKVRKICWWRIDS